MEKSVKEKWKKIIEVFIFIVLFTFFLSLPLLSYNEHHNIPIYISFALLPLMILWIFLYGRFFFDLYMLFALLFIFSSFLSSLFNDVTQFSQTPLVLTILFIIMYSFYSQDKFLSKAMEVFGYAMDVFAIIFFGAYFKQIISGDFYRLGEVFGPINTIAFYLALGYAFSFYATIFQKKYWKSVFLVLFLALGFLTGSKSFFIFSGVTTLSIIFIGFGKKKLLISLSISLLVLSIIIVFISIPTFSTIKHRILLFIEELFLSEGEVVDLSTASRISMVKEALFLFLKKPFLGWGTNGYELNGTWGGYSHNTFSEIACNFGISGLLFFFVPYTSLMIKVLFIHKNVEKEKIILSILLIIIVLSFFTGVMFRAKQYFVIISFAAAFTRTHPIFIKDNKYIPLYHLPIIERKSMRTNKLLYFGGFDLPDNNAAAHRVINNSKTFKELGYDVSLYGLTRGTSYKKKFEWSGLCCRNFKYPKTIIDYFLRFFSPLTNIGIIHKEKPSIVVFYNLPSVTLFLLTIYCKNRNIVVINDVTEWYKSMSRNIIIRSIKNIDSKVRMKLLNRYADGLILVSSFLYNYYETKKKIQLPPLVDIIEDRWANNHRNEGTTLKFVFAGNPDGFGKDNLSIFLMLLEEYKNINNNIDIVVNIIGISKSKYSFLYNMNIPSSLEHSVKFLGRLSHEETIQQVKQSDVAIILREASINNLAGFPTKYVEAQTCGIKVLSTSVGDLKKVIINGVNGYIFDSTSPLSFFKAIDNLLKDKKTGSIHIPNEYKNKYDYRLYIDQVMVFLKETRKDTWKI